MTRDQAWKKIRRLLGPKARIETGEAISSPERRAVGKAAHEAHRAALDELQAEIDRLVREFYQTEPIASLRAKREKMRKDTAKLPSATYKKFIAGTVDTFIPGFPVFHIKASGDTWEEVIAILTAQAEGRQR